MRHEWEFDLQLFAEEPIDLAGGEEELPPEELDDEKPPGESAGGEPGGAQGDEEEMPDDLLSPDELAERTRERAAAAPVERDRQQVEDRDALRSELREIFGGLRQEQPPAREREQPARPEIKPFTLSEEKAEELTNKILSQPGGLAKAIAWAVNMGEQRGAARVAASTEGAAAMESAGEAFADRYVARKLRDPNTKYGKLTEPAFQDLLGEFNLADLARMPAHERTEWLEATWERATGRALSSKSTIRPAASPGVARGAGAKPGAPNRGRVVIRLKDSEKQQVYASLPNNEEGRRRAARQIWEIEHGQTSDRAIAKQVGESMRFAEAVSFGG